MSNYNINVTGSTFDHGSSVVNSHGSLPDKDDAILTELQKIQKELEQSEPLISQALSTLQEAIRKNDSSKISSIARSLSTGTIANVIGNVASGALMTFLRTH